ncbi:MAG: glycosyltransferase [Patescibacteria group bacterium]
MILIAIPCYNEEKVLENNVSLLLSFCKQNLKEDFRIIIADNDSSDKTKEISRGLENNFVKYLFIPHQGKGIAIKKAWQSFKADIYCFMDADLAVDLNALPDLISGIKEGYDVCLGSRSHSLSQVKRSFFRKAFSFVYGFLFKMILNSKITDAPCGFKAINQKAKESILPLVSNEKWFFDSEILVLAERRGCKIKEIPVKWSEPLGRESRAGVFRISWEYWEMLWKTRKRLKNS